jgi:hypothetical protein
MMKVMVGCFKTDAHNVMTAIILVIFVLILAGADTTATFYVFTKEFLCNLVDVSTSCQYQGCILFNVNSLTHKVMERLCPIQRLSFLD